MTDTEEMKACREARQVFERWADQQGWDGAGPFRRQLYMVWKGALDWQKTQQAVSESDAWKAIYTGMASEVHSKKPVYITHDMAKAAFRALSEHYTITRKEPTQ